MAEEMPFKDKIKTLQVMNRTGAGSRTRDVRASDGTLAKETREGDPDDKGYVTHVESGADRVDCVVQPNLLKVTTKFNNESGS